MALYALDAVGDAIDATREFLTPVDVRRWLKLAVVVFFLSGGTGTSLPTNAASNAGSTTGTVESVEVPSVLAENAVAIVLAVVALFLVVGLVFALVGAVFEFVFVEALRSDEVAIRRNARRYWRRGLRLFGFRVLLGLATAALIVGVGAAVFLSVGGPPRTWEGQEVLVAVLLSLPLVVPIAAVATLVNGFTTVFVVPVMLLEDRGVVAGWRRFWPTLAGAWRQYLVYLLVGIVLTVAVGLVVGVAMAILAVALLIPFGILGAVAFAVMAAGGGLVGAAVLALLAVGYLLSLFVLAAVVQVPAKSYLRYYALFVLGDTDADLDLIPERRAAVREA